MPSVTEWLAGGSSCDDMNTWALLLAPPIREGGYVIMAGHIGPVPCKYRAAPSVAFYLPDKCHAGALQPQS